MKLNVRAKLYTVQYRQPIFRQLITWENQIAIKAGYCAACRPKDNEEPQGQFSMVPVHVINADGSWDRTYAENTLATNLTIGQLFAISRLQIPDDFSVDQKMTWATWGCRGTWGGIMRGDGGEWTKATNIQMIASVYAGQWVEVLEEKPIWSNFGGTWHWIQMSRIKTFQSNEWHLPGATQLVTAVTSKNEHYDTPKGYFRMPIHFGDRTAWVFNDWLER